jgi:hypothetical protein
MPEYDNEMRGALFKNKDKDGDDKRPDYKGRIQVDGTEYWLSAWINESRTGEKYMSLRVQEKDKRGGGGGSNKKHTTKEKDNDFDDEIPFITSEGIF